MSSYQITNSGISAEKEKKDQMAQTTRLCQRYRKLYEYEKKERDKLQKNYSNVTAELQKVKMSNASLNDQVKRMQLKNK